MWLRDCYYYLLLLSGPFLRRRRWWRWPVCVDRGWRVRGGTTSGRCRDRGSAPAGRRTRTCCPSAPPDSADSSERAASPPSTTSAFRLAQHVDTHVSLHVVATVFSETFHTSNTQHSYEEQHVAENVHAVFISTFNVKKILFMLVFIMVLHCTAYTVYFHCLRVALNINQSINRILDYSHVAGNVRMLPNVGPFTLETRVSDTFAFSQSGNGIPQWRQRRHREYYTWIVWKHFKQQKFIKRHIVTWMNQKLWASVYATNEKIFVTQTHTYGDSKKPYLPTTLVDKVMRSVVSVRPSVLIQSTFSQLAVDLRMSHDYSSPGIELYGRWLTQRCVLLKYPLKRPLSIINDCNSRFPLWRHQQRASAARREAWRDRTQQRRRIPAASVGVWLQYSIDIFLVAERDSFIQLAIDRLLNTMAFLITFVITFIGSRGQ